MKNYMVIIIFGSILLLTACTTANADTDLEWTHNNNEGEAKNYIAESVNNLNHTPQDAVDKINSLYEGTVVEVELDGEDGVYYYEIEIVNGDVKYDSKVDADNLQVIKLEKGDAESEESLNSVKRITPEDALDIAGGEVEGEITGWELENDEYEILIENGDDLIKIEVDALTADVLNKEVQNDEKNKIDGSGGKGEDADEKKAEENEKADESVKNNDSKAEKSDEAEDGQSPDKEKSGTAEKKDDKQKEQENEQETENAEPAEEPAEKNENKEQKSADDSGQQADQSSGYNNGVLTPEAAMNIALNTVGGIVIEWEYDEDDFEYEIELNVNGQEVEVEINSINGAILEIDYDD